MSLLFGKIDEASYSSIVKSHSTYAVASERTALLVVKEIRERFEDRDSASRILYSSLILDASNKKGKGCVGKIVVFVGQDGVVKQLALRLDTTVTKKALGSSQLTIESLETELGDGIVWIMGITTDAFGAAVEEAILVLKHIDIRACNIYLQTPDVLHRKSLLIPRQVYKYGGKFRVACVRTCQMHNFERILAQMINILMGNQGLAYDMTTAQNLYRLKYYWIKYKSMVDALTVESIGGEVECFKNAPKEIRNLIGSVNATRWLSTERTCDNLLATLSVPTTETLMNYVCKFFGGPESDNWKTAEQYCTCINSSQVSHTMLSFWYMATHTPGAKKSEGAVGCLSVLGFLGSPHHRITTMIVGALYPRHLAWAAFSDTTSQIGIKPMCASTRSIEGVRFDRWYMEEMAKLGSDWGSFIPEAKEFMYREAKRAEDLKLVKSKDEVVTFFNDLMVKGTSDVMKITLKYFFHPGLRPGWVLLQVLDPYVGPRAAKSILKALKNLGLIDIMREERDDQNEAPLTSSADNTEENEVDNSSDEDEDGDIDSDKEYVDNEPGENIVEWTTNSETHAAPTVTMAQYENIIVDGFMMHH
jgi:hypothetical protein